MGDPRGPWQDYGQQDDTGEVAPRHLVGARGPVPTQGFGADHRPTHTRASYRHDDDAPPWTFREAVDRAAWRYRTAPLWAKVSTDVAAASLVVLVLVGVALLLRPDHDPQLAAANGTSAPTAPTVSSTTVPPTTTTSTTVPPTTTTVATTTTTARPVAPPPTEPPPPPTEATTTTQAVSYENCRDAFFAGALPLFAGDPGYGPHLDRDGDGEACEFDERNRY